jgi:hypothetical protein
VTAGEVTVRVSLLAAALRHCRRNAMTSGYLLASQRYLLGSRDAVVRRALST